MVTKKWVPRAVSCNWKQELSLVRDRGVPYYFREWDLAPFTVLPIVLNHCGSRRVLRCSSSGLFKFCFSLLSGGLLAPVAIAITNIDKSGN